MRSASIAAARWRLPICQARSARCTAIAAADFQQFLVGGDDLGVASVLEHQHVAIFEDQRLGKVDEDAVAMHQRDDLAAQMALVMRQDGDVERNLPVGGNLGGAHGLVALMHGDGPLLHHLRLLPRQAIVSNRRRIHDTW